MEIALKKASDIKLVQNIEQFEAGKSSKEIQRASIGGWYDNNPQAALLMNMKAVQKNPDDIASWNNLAAQYTMTGMQQHAVPILMNLLEQKPNNSILLNNMGQAFLGMGELTKAANTFNVV
jgi:Tfp pilus assembly protein PilF